MNAALITFADVITLEVLMHKSLVAVQVSVLRRKMLEIHLITSHLFQINLI